jgi:hypothetical protein
MPWITFVMLAATLSSAGASTSSRQRALAELIDQALVTTWQEEGVKATGPLDDAAFLRRLSLDLCGTIPTRDEVEAFLKDRSEDKRERKIEEYLADHACAENFAALWTALLLEAAPDSPMSRPLRPWLEEALAQRMSFADIVRELISSHGRNDENGAVSYALTYSREPESLASVTARTLLGVQIQCAQCHDHPYQSWTQQDFDGFTSFFARLQYTRTDPGTKMSAPVFRLIDTDPEQQRRARLKKLAKLTLAQEIPKPKAVDLENVDESRLQELIAQLSPEIQERIQAAREYEERFGQAVFLGGQELRPTDLLTPREALAEWIVDPENPYFGKAIANRVWQHFFGKGLLEPVDDLTGARDIVLERLLETLGAEFLSSGTDFFFLLGTLVRTQAYALAPATSGDLQERQRRERLFAAHPVRPLSAEQMLHCLLRATVTEKFVGKRSRGEDFEAVRLKILQKFKYAFSDDEAGEEDSFEAGIPQALFLMNGKLTNEAISVKNNVTLQGILDETPSNRERIKQIFYATLSRPPTRREMERLGKLIKGSGGHGNGVEDLYWSLLNSSEFLSNH